MSAASELTGLTKLFADLIASAGEAGVGALTLLETLIPPIPSEVVLPLSGYLAQQGHLALGWVIAAATLGSLIGAWIFYALGARLGLDRSITALARIPIMDEQDLRNASTWLQQHGRGAVFYGRLIPGVRSLISLPAGAQRMSLASFTVATATGSLLWTSVLVGVGYAVGSNWEKVGNYASVLSNLVIVLLLALATATVIVRARRRNRSEPVPDDVGAGQSAAAPR